MKMVAARMCPDSGFSLSDFLLLVALACAAATVMYSSIARGMVLQYSRAAASHLSGYASYFEIGDGSKAAPAVIDPAQAAIASLEARQMPSYGAFSSVPDPRPGPERVPRCFPACGTSALRTL